MLNVFKGLIDYNVREVNRLQKKVAQVNAHEDEMRHLADEDFPRKTVEYRELIASGKKTLDELLPEAYALAREAARRTLNQRHFDTQVLAGIALHEGKIAEQKTGEGKTLTATLPLYLNALTGKGAHLVTVNDYLARRDAGWMGAIFHFLGMSSSAIISDKSFIYDATYTEDSADSRLTHLRPTDRKAAYQADITYGINSEFGFDYLRDNMASHPDELVQRGFHFAIVDEADSVLIDEARTPHIISAPVERDVSKYYTYAKVIRSLDSQKDYVLDEKLRTANLTEQGITHIEQLLGIANIYQDDFDTIFHIEAALKAMVLFRRDKDYIVSPAGEVVIVDEFTGRLLEGRRFSEGLHQAIEAKENVTIKQESKTLATVSLQNYFRMYTKLSGMTGTAATEAEEFTKIYKTDVLTIPTHRPMIRKDLADAIYKTEKAKYDAVADEIARQHATGRPVLVGTTSIEKNEYLSSLLKKRGITHELLNAKNHEREAAIIEKAGQHGAVTVATNMAGRGVDIVLESDAVKAAGGLCVIGTERHESRRIDNQLRGRAGRQGDPGSTQFFVSLEDDLMRIFGGEQISRLMNFFNLPEDQPLSHSMVNRAIEGAQKKVEGHNFDIRKHLVDYDDVLNKQREIVYALRVAMLQEQSHEGTQDIFNQKLRNVIARFASSFQVVDEMPDEAQLDTETADLRSFLPLELSVIREHVQDTDKLYELIQPTIAAKIATVGEEPWYGFMRHTFLATIDQYWTQHLTTIEDLREGINLRGYAQMDPLVEYKNEAFRLFEELVNDIEYESVRRILTVEITPQIAITDKEVKKDDNKLVYHAASATDAYAAAPAQAAASPAPIAQLVTEKVGRNDPCPCGAINPATGKPYKYKNCGLINAPHHKG